MKFWLTDGVFHREDTYRNMLRGNYERVYEDRGIPFEIPDDAETVVVPEGTTCVGVEAFRTRITKASGMDSRHLHWTKLKKVILPEGVKKLDNCAFEGCALLEEIALPASMVELGFDALSNTGIRTITIPENVQMIDSFCFSWCKRLEEIKLPSKPMKIASDAFSNCSSLKRLVVPPRLNNDFLFGRGFANDPVYAQDSLQLMGCSALEELCVPEHATELVTSAFTNCTSLTEAVIPNGIKKIGIDAFAGCTSLNNLVIPEGVTEIGAQAFENCASLKELVVPASVRKVDPSAFRKCTGLERVVLKCAFKGFESAFPDSPNVVRVEITEGNDGKAAAAFPNAEIYNLKGKLLRSPNAKDQPGKLEGVASPALNGEIVAKSGVPRLKNATYELTLGKHKFQVSFKGAISLNKQTKLALSNVEPEEGSELYDAKELSGANCGDLYDIDPHTGVSVEKLKLERSYVVGGTIHYSEPLTMEAIRSRAVAFANKVAACTEPKNVLKILDFVPKKKNQTLYKGKITPIVRCALANHGGDALALIAKNVSDTELELNVKRVYIGEEAYKDAKDSHVPAAPVAPKKTVKKSAPRKPKEDSFNFGPPIVTFNPEEHKQLWMERYGKYIEKGLPIDFKEKLFAFTGVDDNDPIIDDVIDRGGDFHPRITSKVNYLVVNPYAAGESKIKEVLRKREKGIFIHVILADELEQVLNDMSK